MGENICSVIVSTGGCIPDKIVKNSDFFNHEFYNKHGVKIEKPTREIVDKLEEVSGIQERRYVKDGQDIVDIAFKAAEEALKNSGYNNLDGIILARNFGGNNDLVPATASRIKNMMKIDDPRVIAYDIIAGSSIHDMALYNDFLNLDRTERILVTGEGIDIFIEESKNPVYLENLENAGNKFTSIVYASEQKSVASEVRERLGIKKRDFEFDLVFGCPGWLHGMHMADNYLKSSRPGKKILVIGAETLSKHIDSYDPDSMLYADGAGAVVLESILSKEKTGIISYSARSDTTDEEVCLLRMEPSYNPAYKNDKLFLKMDGHKVFKYAVEKVPEVIMEAIEIAGLNLSDIRLFLVHQANKKLDEAIIKRVNGKADSSIMPMTIHKLGNSSVATLGILYYLIKNGDKENIFNCNISRYNFIPKSYDVFGSVGAGMNRNAMVYRFP